MTKHIEKEEEVKPSYKFRIFIFMAIIFLFLLYLYARYVGTTGLTINETLITNSKIPDSFNGVTIAQISDLHYGRTVNEKELKNIVKQVNGLNPDIVIFTGDLIDKDTIITTNMVETVTNELKSIDSTIGKYAVVGNHDYNNDFYKKILENSSFTLLNNNYDLIYYKSMTPIFIGGLGDYTYADSNIGSVMNYFNDNKSLYTIILMHEPDYMTKMVTYNIDLVLAGHSHNGQVRLPFIGKIYTPKGSKIYYLPHYKINSTDMYISSGVGCSSLNVRLFDRPSINFYRLKNK